MNRSKVWSTRMLVTAAVCMALSFLLSYVRLFSMPQGGDVTACSMLPLMLFACCFGVKPGLAAGAAYGILQLLQRPQIVHPLQLILDYPLAFAMLGLAGLFRSRDTVWAFPAGVVIACAGRFLCHLISGMVFFGSYAPSSGFWALLTYSLLYNGGYMAAEAVISAFVCMLPPVRSAIRRIRKL